MMTAANGIPCEGWWEQLHFGRQPMRELSLKFESGQISGSGHDVIGLFTFAGTINAQGQVTMVKRYLGQHAVNYLGTYDGEGLMWGEWHIGTLRDRWMIRIKGSTSTAAKQTDIEEIV